MSGPRSTSGPTPRARTVAPLRDAKSRRDVIETDPATRRGRGAASEELTGRCACGRVRYRIQGKLVGPVTYCHCWRCRKQSGSSFGTTAGLDPAALTFLSGEEAMRSWESSPGVHRFFASCCGSPIYKRDAADPHELGFRLGTLDADPGVIAEMHYCTGSRAPWVEIADRLPRDESGPPFGARG